MDCEDHRSDRNASRTPSGLQKRMARAAQAAHGRDSVKGYRSSRIDRWIRARQEPRTVLLIPHGCSTLLGITNSRAWGTLCRAASATATEPGHNDRGATSRLQTLPLGGTSEKPDSTDVNGGVLPDFDSTPLSLLSNSSMLCASSVSDSASDSERAVPCLHCPGFQAGFGISVNTSQGVPVGSLGELQGVGICPFAEIISHG
eukprot:12332858-Alexandrium_andersonii.AAC.2